MPQKSDGQPYSVVDAINRNADELGTVEQQVAAMRQDILRLRSMYMGLVELVRDKAPFQQAELDAHVQKAWSMIGAHGPAAVTAAQAAAHPGERLRTCGRCGKQVPASQITVLAGGELCDVCVNT
jgi:hypothetical protein